MMLAILIGAIALAMLVYSREGIKKKPTDDKEEVEK